MPKVANKVPEGIRPYAFHKLNLRESTGGQYLGDCPFCGGSDKLFVNQETGQYRCVVCPPEPGKDKHGGNVYTFLRELHSISQDVASEQDWEDLAAERKYGIETLQRWSLVRSAIDGTWLIPQFSPKKEINNLYRWKYGTPGITPGLFGLQFWDDSKPEVYLSEGWGSTMSLEEQLRHTTRNGSRLVRTSNEAASLYATANVLGVPGCSSFDDAWRERFRGKVVYICYDSDWPKRICKQCKKSCETVTNSECPSCGISEGKNVAPAGYSGSRMVANKLYGVAKAIYRLRWGEADQDVGYDPSYPSGYDLREHFAEISE